MPGLTPAGPDAALDQALRAAFGPAGAPARLGVAVSGGGDSMALLQMLAARGDGPRLHAVTVDHGLRPEAAAEAQAVARACAALGLPHAVLRWQGWDGQGNLMDAARRARLRLIGAWAREAGIGAVALGHTADDQAETFLMRLARGSGVDGLSGMALARRAEGVVWLRPLLAVRRAALRDWLVARGIGWAEDPTNDDAGFDRVKARRALADLAPLGLTVERIVATQARLAGARQVLRSVAHGAALRGASLVAGAVRLDRAMLAAEAPETRLRLLAHAMGWITGADYRPRLDPLTEAEAALASGGRRTLGGCLLWADRRLVHVCREPRAALAAAPVAPGAVWDRRWIVTGPATGPGPAAEIRALGEEGLSLCPGWRRAGLPRAVALGLPGVWLGGRLLEAPQLCDKADWRALPACDPDAFAAGLLSD